MKWIDDLTAVYDQYFNDSFDRLGFSKYEEVDGPGMGALMKFRNDSFKIRLLNDKGIIETGLSSLFGDEQFVGLEIFASLLKLQQSDGNFGRQEIRKILGTRMGFAEQRDFTVQHHVVLAELLNQENHGQTLKTIGALVQMRFGYKS